MPTWHGVVIKAEKNWRGLGGLKSQCICKIVVSLVHRNSELSDEKTNLLITLATAKHMHKTMMVITYKLVYHGSVKCNQPWLGWQARNTEWKLWSLSSCYFPVLSELQPSQKHKTSSVHIWHITSLRLMQISHIKTYHTSGWQKTTSFQNIWQIGTCFYTCKNSLIYLLTYLLVTWDYNDCWTYD